MNQLLDVLTLKPLKGNRTQWTIVLFGIINILADMGILKLTPDDIANVNQFLTWAGAYFFVDKVNSVVPK